MPRPLVAVGLMCKAPRVGLSKTRLAAVVGAVPAAELSAAFLTDVGTMVGAVAAETGARPVALFMPLDGEAEVRARLPSGFAARPQMGDGLAAVMMDGLAGLLAEADAAILIGADVPTVPAEILRRAIDALAEPRDRLVIAPSADGGYFLIGMRRVHRRVFEDIVWSTDTVFQTTLARAREIGLETLVLPIWHDVDDAETFGLLRETLQGRPPTLAVDLPPGPAPATRAAMERLGLLIGDAIA